MQGVDGRVGEELGIGELGIGELEMGGLGIAGWVWKVGVHLEIGGLGEGWGRVGDGN